MNASQPDLSGPVVVRLHLEGGGGGDRRRTWLSLTEAATTKLTSERSVGGLDLEVLTSFDDV